MSSLVKRMLPGRRIFFVYTHNNPHKRFRNGLKANTEISHWVHKALKEHFPRVTFLRFQEEKPHRLAAIGPKDIVVGHVGETFLKASQKTKRLIAFYPWCGHEDRSFNTLFNGLPYQEEFRYLALASSVIFLTSEYNVREYLQKARNFWHAYFTHSNKRLSIVHQPIDLSLFSRIKWDYETSNFLYVGNDAHMKCIDDAKNLVASLSKTLHLYGIEGKKLDNLNREQVTQLPLQADFFIQPGMWEGQCVAILEAAARGFIPIVTPETGYPYDHPFLLRFDDFDYNKKVLEKLLRTTPEERKELADHLHLQLVNDPLHNNWKRLTDKVVEEVKSCF